jgi:hypothetical protein
MFPTREWPSLLSLPSLANASNESTASAPRSAPDTPSQRAASLKIDRPSVSSKKARARPW